MRVGSFLDRNEVVIGDLRSGDHGEEPPYERAATVSRQLTGMFSSGMVCAGADYHKAWQPIQAKLKGDDLLRIRILGSGRSNPPIDYPFFGRWRSSSPAECPRSMPGFRTGPVALFLPCRARAGRHAAGAAGDDDAVGSRIDIAKIAAVGVTAGGVAQISQQDFGAAHIGPGR